MNHPVKTVAFLICCNDSIYKKIFAVKKTLPPEKEIRLEVNDSTAKKITSKIELKNKLKNPVKLEPFDSAVFDAAISEWLAGNEYTTPARIWHILGGDCGNNYHTVPARMRTLILESIHKLANVVVKVTPSDDTLKIHKGLNSSYYGRILKVIETKATISGLATDAIKIESSILYKVAAAKNQIKRVAQRFFNVQIRHTEKAIVTLHYLLRRISEIIGTNNAADAGKKCKRLRSVILLDSLLKDCGFDALQRWKRQDIRAIAIEILDSLVEINCITGWNFETADASDAPHESPPRAIKLTFPRKLCTNS